jgi:hypothetical protein
MSELLVNFFGRDWLCGGRLALIFVNGGVQQGDEVTCRGTVVDMIEDNGGVRHELDIWMEKRGGTRVVVGEASGLIRSD